MSKIDLLTVYPCRAQAIQSIDNIECFHSMKAYFLTRAFNALDHNYNIVQLFYPNYYQLGKNKIICDEFLDLCKKQNIDINRVENILFGSVCMFTFFKFGIERLMNIIPGKIIRSEDCEGKAVANSRVVTISHYRKKLVDWNVINGGLIVASDVFVPKQDWGSKVLKIHVDHNYKNVPEIFSSIKNLLFKIQQKIKGHTQWNELIIYYHDRQCSIDDLGHFNFKTLPITELAELYGQCHISIMSHKESLGMYPLEVKSAGSVLISENGLLVPELQNEYGYLKLNSLDLDLLLDKDFLIKNSIEGRKQMIDYDIDRYAKKILDIIST